MESLLPKNATQLEKNIESAISRDIPIDLADIYNPHEGTSQKILSHLKYFLQTIFLNKKLSLPHQKKLILNSFAINSKIGSVKSIKNGLNFLGYSNFSLIDKQNQLLADGKCLSNGSKKAGVFLSTPFSYCLILGTPITFLQSKQIKIFLESFSPIRAKLEKILFNAVAAAADGKILADGKFSAGIIYI